jgi:integral membrane protein
MILFSGNFHFIAYFRRKPKTMSLLSTSLGRLRLFSFLEGFSLLVLLGFAMPMKYMMNEPIYVRVIGMAHGLLFVGFILFLFMEHSESKWKISKSLSVFLLSSFVPFGFIYVDRKLLK